jgi:hypothetical protein
LFDAVISNDVTSKAWRVLTPEPSIMCHYSAVNRRVQRTAKLVATRSYNIWFSILKNP